MNEKDNKTLICVAVITLVGTLCTAFFGAAGSIATALINNFDKFFPEKKEKDQQVELYVDKTKVPNETKQEETGTEKLSDVSGNIVNFDKSVLIFKDKKFIEDSPVVFLEGKVSITIFDSSAHDCKMRVFQRISNETEIVYKLMNGSPLPVSIGGVQYFFCFVTGQYRKYCVITSYSDQ